MGKSSPSLAHAWLEAGKDLGVNVIHSYDLESQEQIYHYIVLITDFGSAKGTLILSLEADKSAIKKGSEEGFFVSQLSEDSYGFYNKSSFIDTLNDWGYFGERSACPLWYTGEVWGGGEKGISP